MTVEALNAGLGDVLRAACSQIGTILDLPEEVDEHVVGTFGPGPPREVLASLLNGSPWNYVMLGSDDDPRGVTRLVLSEKKAPTKDNGLIRPLLLHPVAKTAEVSPVAQPLSQPTQQPSAERNAKDTQTPAQPSPRRNRRR